MDPEQIGKSVHRSAGAMLHLSGGRANTPHNGTEPVRKHAPPIEAQIDKSGGMSAAGLMEGEYYVYSQRRRSRRSGEELSGDAR